MLRTIRRLTLIASSGAALLALYVPAAQAQPAASATTLPATHVSFTSAVLNGIVDTRGQATEWQFQYGTTTRYGHTTRLSGIPAGQGSVHVSATITGLKPNTTYHFRLIAISGIGSHYVETYYARDRSFKTPPPNGKLLLIGDTLKVSKGLVSATLKCASKVACSGSFSINAHPTSKNARSVGCATKSFRVPAGNTSKVTAKVSNACLALLTKAPHRRLKGTFSSSTTTGQLGENKPVTLMLT